MTVSLDQFNGERIYLDTMVPYMLLRGADENIHAFFRRIEDGALLAYTSVLTFDELAYRLLLAFSKEHYGGSPLEWLRTQEDKMLAEFAPTVVALLRRLQGLSNLTVLDILVSDLKTMHNAMSDYHLRPRDALHLAVIQRINCFDLASSDHHFDRVPHV